MCVVRNEKTYGGCAYCGKPVRAQKQGKWMCQRCMRNRRGAPDSPSLRTMHAYASWRTAQKREREAANVFRGCLIESLNAGQDVRHAALTLKVSVETVNRYVQYV